MKWDKQNIPHKGWTEIGMEDLGEQANFGEKIKYEQCETCGKEKIRYVHIMTFPEKMYENLDRVKNLIDSSKSYFDSPVGNSLKTKFYTSTEKFNKFKIFLKQTIFRLMFEGMMICMLFGLIGCGINKNKPAEEIAKTYLEKTYKSEFVVEELTRKDAGPFKTKEYSGFAYEKENPKNRFKVWVNKESMEIVDSYYSVSVLQKATEWIKIKANDIWENVEVGLVLDVIRPDTDAFYKADEYVPFFENESVECEVYLFLESRDYLTIERYEEFDDVINELLNGYVQIFIIDTSTFKSMDIADFYGKNPDICIRIGAPTSEIKKKVLLGGN